MARLLSTSTNLKWPSWHADARRRSRPSKTVHRLGELDVTLGQSARIVGRERHRHGLVDIEPFRMVVELLGDERSPCHEPERLVEIAKPEGPGDGVAVLDLAPAGKPGERRLAGISGQFLGHRSHSSLVWHDHLDTAQCRKATRNTKVK